MRTIIVALLLGLTCAPVLAADKADAEFAGSCAWGLAEYGIVVPTDCSLSWTDPKTNKLYCFSSQKSKQSFLQNAETNLRKAAAQADKVQKK